MLRTFSPEARKTVVAVRAGMNCYIVRNAEGLRQSNIGSEQVDIVSDLSPSLFLAHGTEAEFASEQRRPVLIDSVAAGADRRPEMTDISLVLQWYRTTILWTAVFKIPVPRHPE